jgi:hypothetical protein
MLNPPCSSGGITMSKLYAILIPLCACALFWALRTESRAWAVRFAMPKNIEAASAARRAPGQAGAGTECKLTPGQSEDEQAWCAFSELIGQPALSDPQSQPAFIYWATKSDIGLDGGTQPVPCPAPVNTGTRGHAMPLSFPSKLANTIGGPVQLRFARQKVARGGRMFAAIAPTGGPVGAAVAESSASLAAVRFNSTACNYLSSLDTIGKSKAGTLPWFQHLVTVASKHNTAKPDLPDPQAGAIIIKTIWQVQVQKAGPSFDPLSWTCQTAQTEGTQSLTQPNDDHKCLNFANDGDGTQLAPISNWSSRNRILRVSTGKIDDETDTAQKDQCAGDLNLAQPSQTIPGMCVYHVGIQYNNKQAQAAIIRGVPELDATGCVGFSCDLILVGVHVMMFVDTPNPHWLWATFWWSPASNGRRLPDGSLVKGPWAHFQMKATSVGIGADPATIVYNPYLEGPDDANGAVSNCIQCHQFAGFDAPKGSKSTLSTSRTRGVVNSNGPAIGLPARPPGNCPAPSTISQAEDLTCAYFLQPGTIQTQRIWSLNTQLQQLLARPGNPAPAH